MDTKLGKECQLGNKVVNSTCNGYLFQFWRLVCELAINERCNIPWWQLNMTGFKHIDSNSTHGSKTERKNEHALHANPCVQICTNCRCQGASKTINITVHVDGSLKILIHKCKHVAGEAYGAPHYGHLDNVNSELTFGECCACQLINGLR